MNETAWMYCKECKYFNKGCIGTPSDYETNGNPPCEEYEYEDKNLITN